MTLLNSGKMSTYNEAQIQAITTIQGPVMVISCAGSGKTTVILERTARILQLTGRPARILVVTFSKAAATEMEERFREKYGASIYASEGERAWIEDIDLQFKERPIPNFYVLAGKSVPVDYVVKDGDEIVFSDNISVHVIGTPGHSADEVSYRINDMVFIGDAVPVKGDIPIFINLEKTKNSLMRLDSLSDVKMFYPAWDQAYSAELLKKKIVDAKEFVAKLEEVVIEVDNGMDNLELVDLVCERLNMPMLKNNPLFARTVECCRKDRN